MILRNERLIEIDPARSYGSKKGFLRGFISPPKPCRKAWGRL